MNRYDMPGQTSIPGHAGAVSAQPSMLRAGGGGVGMMPGGLGGNPPNQLNDLNQPQVCGFTVICKLIRDMRKGALRNKH